MTSRLPTIACGALLTAMALPASTAATAQAPPPVVDFQHTWHGGLKSPSRLAVGEGGTVYVSDPGRGEVVIRAADGRLLERRRGLGSPLGIAVDTAGRVLVGDAGRGSVTAYDRGWQARFQLGAGPGEFALPGDLSIEAVSGRIWVADSIRGEIRAYDANGVFELAFDGSGSPDGPLRFPVGVHALENSGQVVVVDQQNRKVRVFSRAGVQLYSFGDHGDLPGEMYAPQGVWVDDGGRLYLADSRLGRVSIFDLANGDYLGAAGAFGSRPGQLRLPMDLAMDADQRLFVAAADNGRLEIFGVDGAADPEHFVPAQVKVATDAVSNPPLLISIITIPGYRPENVDPATVRVDGVVLLAVSVGDHDGDHVADLEAVFDLNKVLAAQSDGLPWLHFQGDLAGGMEFQAAGAIPGLIFFDGFESGDVSVWSSVVGMKAPPEAGRGWAP